MRNAFLLSLVSVEPLLPPSPTCRDLLVACLPSSPPCDWLEEEASLAQSPGVGEEDGGVTGKP